MKFVLLTQYYPPEVGGAQVFLASLATQLLREGHDVRVVTAVPNYPTGKIFDGYRRRAFLRENRDGIDLFRTWVYPAQSARMIPRLANYFSFCLSSFLAFFWIGKPDFIFVDSPPLFLALTALLLARLKGVKWIMNVSDLWPDAVVEFGMLRPGVALNFAKKLERFLYKHADFVCTVTEGIYKILLRDKNVARAKLLFLPIGVDTDLFQARSPDKALIDQYGLAGKSLFIYAGTMGHAQGLSLLVDAASVLRERQDIAILFIGDGPVKKLLQKRKAELNLSNVIFLNPVPLTEMPGWWSVARAALITLKNQPIHLSARPSKAFPPLASCIPVIFSGAGEMARILSEAEAGIVLPPEQLKPLVESIVRLADDSQLAQTLGRNGRRLCEQEYSWQHIIRKWFEELTLETTKSDTVGRVFSASNS